MLHYEVHSAGLQGYFHSSFVMYATTVATEIVSQSLFLLLVVNILFMLEKEQFSVKYNISAIAASS